MTRIASVLAEVFLLVATPASLSRAGLGGTWGVRLDPGTTPPVQRRSTAYPFGTILPPAPRAFTWMSWRIVTEPILVGGGDFREGVVILPGAADPRVPPAPALQILDRRGVFWWSFGVAR